MGWVGVGVEGFRIVCTGFGSVEAYQQDIDYLMCTLFDERGLRAQITPSSASDRALKPVNRNYVRKSERGRT